MWLILEISVLGRKISLGLLMSLRNNANLSRISKETKLILEDCLSVWRFMALNPSRSLEKKHKVKSEVNLECGNSSTILNTRLFVLQIG